MDRNLAHLRLKYEALYTDDITDIHLLKLLVLILTQLVTGDICLDTALLILNMDKAIGTCMMIILPISAAGGLGYLVSGHLDLSIFLQTLSGLMIGAWFGAKGTHLAPMPVLKFCIVAMPTIGGAIMMVGR